VFCDQETDVKNIIVLKRVGKIYKKMKSMSVDMYNDDLLLIALNTTKYYICF